MAEDRRVTIVTFGDSITEAKHQPAEHRWPTVLEEQLRRRLPDRSIRVVNAGVGGNTTREGLARIENDVLAHNPDFVTIEFGNDITYETDRHVDREEFVANLREIVRRIPGKCILMTFTPVTSRHQHADHPFYAPHGGPDGSEEQYRQLTRELAVSDGLPLVDLDLALRTRMAEDGEEAYILPDGVHLTPEGNLVIAEALLPMFVELLDRA